MKTNIFQNAGIIKDLKRSKYVVGIPEQVPNTLIFLVTPATANISPSLSNSMLDTILHAVLGSP